MRRWPSLVVFLFLAFAAAFIASRFLPDAWYVALQKPAFNPPDWVFPPAWSVLYVLMAIAAWRVWKRDGLSAAIVLWLVQLLFNAAWMWLFFGLHRADVALADILILLVLIVALTFAFWRRDRWAGGLLMPYVAWVAFAAVLNHALWQLNPAV
ncbi:TspO/MBR family protein [Paraburkholderia phytofirmans]|uniref:TspO and MBR like protein n=1 Tax=Paraburkholderia phytofirmans (strain DSM 17436 / LMG 22146 / PsJN) TaxID=398527 RepID=B2T9J2_PARPJ|nr:TspO/MBR family protein [Paraburkholderia phytofirmans]ACD21094.1 TspO and MBR like protein [Paraburkholderia phytofirmans PsJN]